MARIGQGLFGEMTTASTPSGAMECYVKLPHPLLEFQGGGLVSYCLE